MAEQLIFDRKEDFLEGLEKLVQEKVPGRKLTLVTPFSVHEVDEIVPPKAGKVKYFAFIGAGTGTLTGFAFTILTSLSWPLITGGKPIVSIPPFIIIAFALTILFGALSTFVGFLILSRLPSVKRIISPEEIGNRFVIIVEEARKR
jgi:hypothetical protein